MRTAKEERARAECYECRRCGALPGESCTAESGQSTKPHSVRVGRSNGLVPSTSRGYTKMRDLPELTDLEVAALMRRRGADRLGLPVLIHICKDGTISYRRRRGEPVFNGRALPVFSVADEEDARMLQVRFGSLQYRPHPSGKLGDHWYVWTGFDGELESLAAVGDACAEFYYERKRRQASQVST